MEAPLKLPSFLQVQKELTAKFSQTNVTYHFVPHVIYSLDVEFHNDIAY